MLDKNELKKHAALYGIFCGIIIAVFAIIIMMTIFSRSSWRNGLASELQLALNDYDNGTYTVNKFIEVNSPVSTSAAVYSLIKKGAASNEVYYGVIVRIPTIAGPVPAAFISGEKSASGKRNVSFVRFCEDFGKASDLADSRLSLSIIDYWESMVSKIIDKSLTK